MGRAGFRLDLRRGRGARTHPPACERPCVPTSSTATAGCRFLRQPGSAASSPTTWAWARRCRRSPWCCGHRRQRPPPLARRTRPGPRRGADLRAGDVGRRGARGSPRPAHGDPRRRPPSAAAYPCPRRSPGPTWSLTSYAVFRLDAGGPTRPAVGRLGPRRGPVRQEPPVAGPTSAPDACRRRSSWPSPARPWRTTLMDLWSLLSIVAPGLFPSPRRFTETYRRPIESGRLTRAARRAAAADPTDHAAPHQGRRRGRAAAEAGAGHRRRAVGAAPAHLRPAPATRAAEDPRPARRRQPQPDRHPSLAHQPATAQPRPGPRRQGRVRRGRPRRSTPWWSCSTP